MATALAASDEQLLRTFRRTQDEAAFAEIVRRHGRLVMAVSRQAVRDEGDAEDVFQATFFLLAQRADRIRNPAAIRGWLCGVAHRLAVRAARRRSARGEVDWDEHRRSNDDIRRISEHHERQAVHLALESLPEKYRVPLVLRYLVGHSNREVANVMGLSAAAVEGRLKRGKRELRRRLARHGLTLSAVLATWLAARSAAAAMPGENLILHTANQATASRLTAGQHDLVRQLISGEHLRMSPFALSVNVLAASILAMSALLPGHGGVANGPFADGVSHQMSSALTAPIEQPSSSISPVIFTQFQQAQLAPVSTTETATTEPPTPQETPANATQSSFVRSSEDTATDFRTLSRREAYINEMLREETAIEFVEAPLDEIVEYLMDYHDIPILIKQNDLSEEGVTLDTPTTLEIDGANLANTLELILDPLGLDFVVQNEMLIITTRVRADEILSVRIYSTRGLERIDPEQLASVIRTGTTAEWDVLGGTCGKIEPIPGGLVILQNRRGHDQVMSLLNQLSQHAESLEDWTPSEGWTRPAQVPTGGGGFF